MTVTPDEAAAAPARGPTPWVAGAFATIRARGWFIAAVAAVCLLAVIVYMRTADYTYTALLRVAPAPTSSRESGNLGALTSLATLTGATLEAIPVTPFRLYVEGVYTREAAQRLAMDRTLMHQVFADEWDPRAKSWREPTGLGRSLSRSLNTLLGIPVAPWSPPDAARLQAWINANLIVDQTPKTPIVTLSIAATDPAFAQSFLLRLHTTVDDWLRSRTLERTRNNISYLTQRLPAVTLADHRQALFVTLSDQQQREMTATNPAAYAAERFGGAVASPRPTSPRQLLVLAAAIVLGGLAGIAGALIVPRRAKP